MATFFTFMNKHKWKIVIAAVAVLGIAGIAFAAMRPSQEEYLTTTAQVGDLQQTVEAVGTIVSDRDLELQFRTPGIISQVLVKEGDTVRAGQRLASLRAGDLSASVAAASARVKEAEAALRTIREGTRPEEIAIAEAQIANKKASLEAAKTNLKTAQENIATAQARLDVLRQEVSTNLAGQISTAQSTASLKLTTAEQSMASIDDVFGNNDVSDAVNKSSPGAYDSLRAQQNTARTALLAARSKPSPTTYEAALALMEESRSAIQLSVSALTSAYDLVASLPETQYFDNADREAHKATLATKRSGAQTALSDVDAWIKSLKDAAAGQDTRIVTEENAVQSAKNTMEKAQADIQTYETSIRIDEAQLALKRAGSRPSDISAAEARLSAARAELARASAGFSDTVIVAPAAGRITKVHIKPGEITPAGPAITMLGESPYRIEMFVSEIDVPKIQRTQSGSVELDAFPGTHYQLRVSEVDEAQTIVDGTAKYRVKLDFVYPHDEFKLGMSGDVRVVTGERQDVVIIPSRAVLTEGSRKIVRVIGSGGTLTEKEVTTGMDGEGGNIEIVAGVESGATIVVLTK